VIALPTPDRSKMLTNVKAERMRNVEIFCIVNGGLGAEPSAAGGQWEFGGVAPDVAVF